MKRRDIIKSACAMGAVAALPARVLGGETSPVAPAAVPNIASTLANSTLGATPGAPVPASAASLTEYQRRVLNVASWQKQRLEGKLWRTDIVGIADFALPSSQPRLHFANLENGTVRSFYVAHGRGSDPEHDGWLKTFSNVVGSEATSRGAYLTCEWYNGKYGTSIKLMGFDQDNSHALERAIVMHPAWYAAPDMVAKWGKLGRSEGCFAMDPDNFNEALWHLSGGRLLYADRIGV